MSPGVSCTRDKGLGAEGARSPCPRPAFRLLRSLHPVSGSPRLLQRRGGDRAPAAPGLGDPRLAACWPRRRRGLGALGRPPGVKGGSPAAQRVPAAPRWLRGWATGSRAPPPGATQPALLAQAWSLGKPSRWPGKEVGTLDTKGGQLLRGGEAGRMETGAQELGIPGSLRALPEKRGGRQTRLSG